jgi:hypothetical protein
MTVFLRPEETFVKKENILQRFPCGAIEKEFENAFCFVVFMQLIFTIVGGYFFWTMLSEATLSERLNNIAVLLFCLWRIHRQRDVLCYITEKGLIVRRQFMSLQEFVDEQIHEEKSYVFLPYREIFLISDDWREIQLGAAEEGGIAVLPVHLQFLSKKNKQIILDRLREEQEKPDKE